MLAVKTTDHLTGATICGNHSDLNTLYNALSNLVGNEGSYPEYDQCQLRILGLCYEIRHAYQGDRSVFWKNTVGLQTAIAVICCKMTTVCSIIDKG